MTSAMWFVWLLRSDIRNGAAPGDVPAQRELISWWLLWGGVKNIQRSFPGIRSTAKPRNALRTDGVNLVGFVRGQSGLGEDVRAMSAGLNAMGFPHVLLNATDENLDLQPKEVGQLSISDRPTFATSIYCMSAFDMATLYVTRGPEFFAGQYRIGYWPWELSRFPDIWTDAYELVDEIWTGSEFTARAYRANCPKPVICLPAPVTVPAVRPRTTVRIAKNAFVFTYRSILNPTSRERTRLLWSAHFTGHFHLMTPLILRWHRTFVRRGVGRRASGRTAR